MALLKHPLVRLGLEERTLADRARALELHGLRGPRPGDWAAVERQLPILFILSNNASYASIRIHQDREYPGRHRGTSLFNPDFTALSPAFGMHSQRLDDASQVDSTIAGLIGTKTPAFLEVSTSLQVVLPAR